jgi:hypothetical protein
LDNFLGTYRYSTRVLQEARRFIYAHSESFSFGHSQRVPYCPCLVRPRRSCCPSLVVPRSTCCPCLVSPKSTYQYRYSPMSGQPEEYRYLLSMSGQPEEYSIPLSMSGQPEEYLLPMWSTYWPFLVKQRSTLSPYLARPRGVLVPSYWPCLANPVIILVIIL